MKTLGLNPSGTLPHDVALYALAWQKPSANERHIEARKMEIYAAMSARLNWNVGRSIERGI